MEANKKVLALIVTWNGATVIRKCLFGKDVLYFVEPKQDM